MSAAILRSALVTSPGRFVTRAGQPVISRRVLFRMGCYAQREFFSDTPVESLSIKEHSNED
jgi:hypothetical protein